MRKLIDTRKTLSGVSERKDLRAGARSIPTLRCASEMRDFRDLKLWEKAHRLTLAVYKATLVFPKEELYGLTSQIRRASTSIPANIAERCGRSGEAELARFLQIGDGICQ